MPRWPTPVPVTLDKCEIWCFHEISSFSQHCASSKPALESAFKISTFSIDSRTGAKFDMPIADRFVEARTAGVL